jgi:ATP-dependent exoDNAse (exonuclease V) beta subunit
MDILTSRRLKVVMAGAGTGKTHRITSDMMDAIAGGLSAASVLATTFTNKAATELQERVQAAGAKAGHRDASLQLPDALIGTVNAVCGRLLTEFALEAGLPPTLAVLDEVAEKVAFETAISAIVADYEEDIGPIAERLGYDGDNKHASDWVDCVRSIALAARDNRLLPGDVLACLPRALAGVTALLPAPDPVGAAALDAALRDAMNDLLRRSQGWALTAGPDNTRKAVNVVRLAASDFRPADEKFLPWSKWVALTKLRPAKGLAADFVPLAIAAGAQDRHPRLHADIRTLVKTCYQAASRTLEAYAAYKVREGLLDFCDQETLLLTLLERDATIRDELSARLQLMFVDEFQDTSPLQLTLFLRLARLVARSVWVGDPKQAIFAFHGADPALMGSILQAIGPHAGESDILGTSRRSRPGLVDFANALFVPAFAAQGMDAPHVRLSSYRRDLPNQGPPLVAWRLPEGQAADACPIVAGAVVRMLADANRPRVQDVASGEARPVRAGDVAILCKRNETVAAMAKALQVQGLRVAAERGGLLETPEVRLALACLRRLTSGYDTLAAAEIAHLCDAAGKGDWLRARLTDRAIELDPRVTLLDTVRPNAADLSPFAALGEALAVAGVLRVVAAWPDPAQRLANIEALFGCATEYQEACRRTRSIATPSGFGAWLHALDPAPSQPASFGEDAVTVLTYHKAKGLEWPFVVMAELGHERDQTAFDVTVEARADGFDLNDPLAGRWVRFWPWPYGKHSKDVPMGDRAANGPEHEGAQQRANAEAVRLGYVGVTRARDYLVLAIEAPRPRWLERFAPGLAGALLALPAGEAELILGESRHAVTIMDVPPAVALADLPSRDVVAFVWPVGAAPDREPARFSPSRLQDVAAIEPEMIELGPRLEHAGGDARDALGEALHRFLAADDPAQPVSVRLGMATALLETWGGDDGLLPENCLAAADRLWAFVRQRYGGGAQLLRERPLQQRLANGSELHGRIDLLVRHAGAIAVIDHKSFPGVNAKAKAATYLPQLCAYADALNAAGEAVSELVVHLPILGQAAVLQWRT